MTTPSSPKTLFTVSDVLTLTGIVVTVIGIIIALLQWGFTSKSIIISVIGVAVLVYLLIERIFPWFKKISPTPPPPEKFTEELTTKEIDESPPALPLLPSDQAFLNQAIDKLDTSSALMLLAQEHRIQPPVTEAIYQQLQHRFGADYTYHLIPTGQAEATKEQYFSLLGQQLGWQRPCKDAIELEKVLAGKLPQDQHLYLFLSRLEKGHPERAKELAIALRGLVQSGKLKVLLLGGGKLEELKFKADTTSLLNIAVIERWPELTAEDVQWLYEQHGPHHSPLTAKDQQDDLEASGGHFALLRNCLEYRANTPAGNVIDYLSQLQQETLLVNAFARFRRTPEPLKQLCEWLSQAEVGPAQPYIFDDLLREVYWLNLLVARGGRLVWRGEAVRQAGLQTLGCPSHPA